MRLPSVFVLLLGLFVLSSSGVWATSSDDGWYTMCHRVNSQITPYVAFHSKYPQYSSHFDENLNPEHEGDFLLPGRVDCPDEVVVASAEVPEFGMVTLMGAAGMAVGGFMWMRKGPLI